MQPLFAYQRRILLVLIFVILAGLILKLVDRQRQAVGFDIKGFLDGYKYTTTVDTSNKVVTLSTNAMDTGRIVPALSNNETLEELTVNVNLADEVELQKLPGIGPVLANRIVAYRTANGVFKNFDDLSEVEGVGEKKLAKMKEYIKF